MRIVGGTRRGLVLADVGEGDAEAHLRPTSDRVREAIFNLLTNSARENPVPGARVLDLFAGTGALGLEALSRGAARATFVEHDRKAVDALRANVEKLGANANVLAQRVETLGAATAPHHVALLDPPYGENLAAPALARLAERGWLAPQALVSVETGRTETLDVPGFTLDTTRHHGKALLHLFRYDGG